MKIVRFLKWIPVGTAAAIVSGATVSFVTGSTVSVSWQLMLGVSSAIALILWALERDHLNQRAQHGTSFPLHFVYWISGMVLTTAILLILVGLLR